ncbi:MAG: flavodoxin family protein [Clostridia bacterium]|nr:flavodoxin family protein [Clostridia bacterium]
MSKKILIISSSPRKNGNSEMLCQRFQKGAEEVGHVVRLVNLNDYNIGFCKGCYACSNNDGVCFQNDDMASLADKLISADVIVFATPVYFYSMSGQLKTFIDRLVPVYEKLTKKDVYIFVTAADENEEMLESTVEAIRGLTRDCMEGTKEKGVIKASGVTDIGDIKGTDAYKQAYELGKNS